MHYADKHFSVSSYLERSVMRASVSPTFSSSSSKSATSFTRSSVLTLWKLRSQ